MYDQINKGQNLASFNDSNYFLAADKLSINFNSIISYSKKDLSNFLI
jgi:hypothetical protein